MNLKKISKTLRSVQCYQCKTCGKTSTETTGILFYRKHTQEHEILELLALLAEGNCVSTLAWIKEDNILRWPREAGWHADKLEAVLMEDFCLQQAQLDGLWSLVRNKGENSYPETTKSGALWILTFVGQR